MLFDIVIPTIGRPSLHELLRSLARSHGPLPERIAIVDDRKDASAPLSFAEIDRRIASRIHLIRGGARGPAAARNAGWRSCSSTFIAFLDDDVHVDEHWLELLQADLAAIDGGVAGSQARLDVPLPDDRRPTDWERNVASLAQSQWITADMVYRREVLQALNGFDERFKRAYREDADFALRAVRAGYRIVRGTRHSTHPVRSSNAWISVRLQAGNADDVLMRALHGRHWREEAGAPHGRWPLHLLTVACAAGWAALTAEFAWRRIHPGPRTPREVSTMLATSAVIPFAAVYHRTRASIRLLRGIS